jgi:hypothetical protein
MSCVPNVPRHSVERSRPGIDQQGIVCKKRGGTTAEPWLNQLYFGDNLAIFREYIADEA